MNHTPTPWKIQQNKNNKFEIFVIEEHGLAYWICEHVEKHDAEFIVRAVNSHDELLFLVKIMKNFLLKSKEVKLYKGFPFDEALERIEQAIAAAERKE